MMKTALCQTPAPAARGPREPLRFTREISAPCARRIALSLVAKLGTPEGSSWSERGGQWCTETTWRYRRPDGSPWARLGYGATRKMVTLSRNDSRPDVVRLHVYVTAEGRA